MKKETEDYYYNGLLISIDGSATDDKIPMELALTNSVDDINAYQELYSKLNSDSYGLIVYGYDERLGCFSIKEYYTKKIEDSRINITSDTIDLYDEVLSSHPNYRVAVVRKSGDNANDKYSLSYLNVIGLFDKKVRNNVFYGVITKSFVDLYDDSIYSLRVNYDELLKRRNNNGKR